MALHEDIATYAKQNAGTDNDKQLEASSLEHFTGHPSLADGLGVIASYFMYNMAQEKCGKCGNRAF